MVQEAVDSGISEVIFVTGRGKDNIEDHFDEIPELEQVLEERGQGETVQGLRRIAEMIESATSDLWGRSSAGRASRSQREGRGFDSPRLHQSFPILTLHLSIAHFSAAT